MRQSKRYSKPRWRTNNFASWYFARELGFSKESQNLHIILSKAFSIFPQLLLDRVIEAVCISYKKVTTSITRKLDGSWFGRSYSLWAHSRGTRHKWNTYRSPCAVLTWSRNNSQKRYYNDNMNQRVTDLVNSNWTSTKGVLVVWMVVDAEVNYSLCSLSIVYSLLPSVFAVLTSCHLSIA